MLGPILMAIGRGLLAIVQFFGRVVWLVLVWLLSIALKRPLQSVIVFLMLVVLGSIYRAGPNNPLAVERAIRLVLPIAIILVAIVVGRRFLKPPKL